MTKDAGLRLRVERALREDFVAACRSEGKAAAETLREFMRAHVERQHAGQQELFAGRAGERIPGTKNKLPQAHPRKRRKVRGA